MGIEVKNVIKSFGSPPTTVLHEISITIQDGEFVSLTGKSGSGKSTLLYLMSSLDNPSSGHVIIDNQNVSQMTSRAVHQFRNRNAGFVFQFHYLLPELTALENVLLPTIKLGQMKAFKEQAHALLREFELSDKCERLPSQLSGGEMQRVAIARALVMNPKYFFADEPTGNLDSASGNIVMDLIQRINKERGTTVIMVTHDPDYAALAKTQVNLVDGRIANTFRPSP